MIVIRNVFTCKPGQAKELVKTFKRVGELMKEAGMGNSRVFTDMSAPFWTVVFETEAETFASWEQHMSEYGSRPEIGEAMKGYMEFVTGGYREIWRVE
jgi:hypothetical protein